MKKLFALVLTVVMLAVMAVSASAEVYPVNSETLEFRSGSGDGLSIAADGKTIVLNKPTGEGNPANWSNAQLLANDSLTDGFTVKISNIKWDDEADNCVGLVYSNYPGAPYTGLLGNGFSCFTLLARKDGSIVFWGNGCNSNHPWGMWLPVCVVIDGVFDAKATSFTYSMAPKADGTGYEFYVNDAIIYDYVTEDVKLMHFEGFHNEGIFASPERPCGFGFMVFDGTGDSQTGWGTSPVGKLSYTIEEVNSVGTIIENPRIPGIGNGGNDVGNDDPADNPGSDETTTPPIIIKPKDTTAAATTAAGDATTGAVSMTTLIVVIAVAAAVVVAAVVVVIIVVTKSKKPAEPKDKE